MAFKNGIISGQLRHLIKYVCVASILLLLTGCDSKCLSGNKSICESGDSGGDGNTTKKYSAQITYINGVQEAVDFHSLSGTSTKDIYDSEQLEVSVASKGRSFERNLDWSDDQKVRLAMQDSNSKSKQKTATFTLENNLSYWSIGWLDNNNYAISLVKKSASNVTSKYSLRIFANEELDIKIADEQNTALKTQAGKVTQYFAVDDCDGLTLGLNKIDLCKIATAGKSYLVVADRNGTLVVSQE